MLKGRLHNRPVVKARTIALSVFSVGLTMIGGALLTSAQTTTPSPTAAADCPAGTPTSGAASELCIGEFDIYYKPNLATVPSDQAVKAVLHNQGEADHNFSITDHGNPGLKNLNISVTTKSGETGEATINAPEGVYYFFCNQPGHEAAGMRGYLTVKKDAPLSTSEATVTPRAG